MLNRKEARAPMMAKGLLRSRHGHEEEEVRGWGGEKKMKGKKIGVMGGLQISQRRKPSGDLSGQHPT